jgi:hypothetical protein
MTDDRFEAFLLEALKDYNRPPETPREQMWSEVCGALPFPAPIARALAAYNLPPETPVQAMWECLQGQTELNAAVSAALQEYNRPGAAPVEAMWTAIRSEQALEPTIASALKDYNRPRATPAEEMWSVIQSERELEPVLASALVGYNAPPDVAPRELMWEAIAKATAAKDPIAVALDEYNRPPVSVPREEMWRVVAGQGGVVRSIDSARRWINVGRHGWQTAAAAALLIAVGFGAGRFFNETPASTANPVRVNAPAVANNVLNSDSTQVASGGESTEQPAGEKGSAGSESARTSRESGVAPKHAALASIKDVQPLTSAEMEQMGQSVGAHLVAVQHLSQVETLLTSFKTNEKDKKINAQLGKWARNLLTNTRVLLESPVGADPDRRKLLEALEVILMQMVQLSPDATKEEREMVNKALKQEGMLGRVRAAVTGPSGS